MNLRRLPIIVRHFGYNTPVASLPRFYDTGADFGLVFTAERNDWLQDIAFALAVCGQIDGGMRMEAMK